MELSENVETINRQLVEHFGFDSDTRDPMWRVVISDHQYEKRETEWSPEGLHFVDPQVMELPKYPWIKGRWILERLVLVPEVNRRELLDKTKSYEVIWVFETQQGAYLPPKFEAAKFVIDTVYAAQGKRSMRKYIDEEAKNPVEKREERIKNITTELFGNETDTGDALAHGEGVGYTGPIFEEIK